jgi:hypothetical protein
LETAVPLLIGQNKQEHSIGRRWLCGGVPHLFHCRDRSGRYGGWQQHNSTTGGNMAFTQKEVFPIISRIITDYAKTSHNYMDHPQIIAEMLKDQEMRPILDRLPTVHPRLWWASNMKQWFSQRITAVELPERGRYLRVRMKNGWAYRLEKVNPQGSRPF